MVEGGVVEGDFVVGTSARGSGGGSPADTGPSLRGGIEIDGESWGCGCGGFHPPDSAINAQTSRNTDAALYLFEQADCPYREAGTAATYCS